MNAAAKKPNPDTAAAAYNNMGQALAKMGNLQEASDAYEGAAKQQPTQASMYYYNEAATLYNAGKMDEAVTAADKSIEADPKRAEAYYIKGQSADSEGIGGPEDAEDYCASGMRGCL